MTLPAKLSATITAQLGEGETITRDPDNRAACLLTLPIVLGTRGARTTITAGAAPSARHDRTLIGALRRAHAMVARDAHGPIFTTVPSSQYARRIAGLAMLAPAIQRDILAGRQPPALTLATLVARDLPLGWDEQRAALGWDN